MWSQATWQFINTFADWFAAAGTIAAVMVAIYLARLDRTVRLKISAGMRLMVTPGVPGPHPEYLWITAVNIGHRDAQITTISWRVGLLWPQRGIQSTINDGVSSPLPIRLKDGEEARWLIPLKGEGRWVEDFVAKFLQPNPRIRSHFIWLVIYTSVGRSFKTRIEKGLREALLEAVPKAGAR
jgi:hypothetical protein